MPDLPPDSIAFEPLFPGVLPPTRATEGSAGYDVRAHLQARTVRCSDGVSVSERPTAADGRFTIPPGVTALIPLGFRARLPSGHEAQVRLRSSVAFKKGLLIPNAPGTIDADYPDEWMVMLRNPLAHAVTIEHGERIAQVILNRFAILEWEEGAVRKTTRAGGVGSTGQF